jgi:PleD family two-component response regulator
LNEAADAALYEAKQAGRDCIRVAANADLSAD